LPRALMTQPGERRRLYMDIALSSGFTINAPISTMGLDVFRRLASDIVQVAFGVRHTMPSGEDALIVLDGGRMYLDLSNVMWLGGPRMMARKMRMADAMVARILESIDPREYRASRRPGWARLRHLWRLPVAGWRMRRLIANSVLPFIASERSHRRIVQQLSAYERELAASPDNAMPLAAYWDRYVASRLQTLFDVSMASVGPGVLAVQAFTHLAKPITHNDPELEGKLDRGFEGNVVVDMSIAMQRLARQLPTAQHADARELEGRLNAGALPASFMEEWNHFLRRFGHRGPMEMDVAQPRYGDAPGRALTQIAAMAVDSDRFDLAAASQRQIQARRVAAAAVIQKAGPIRRRLLQRLHWIVEHFAGMRDTPKHHVLLILHGLRRRLFLEGEQLVRDGRLDTAEQVFDLTIEELIAASNDPELDLRANRDKRLGFYEHLARQVINFPSVIDSRGRILRAPRSTPRHGEFCGVGLSPGIAAGPARTLRSPHEKPLAKGEILIAYTTDPGWTPIFTSAAAVVLEIGGALQHGAVVARELGLPCVAGIEGVATAIRDGQLIEVDGSLGTVRLMPTS
jgi:rifampicin phosphotransferase